jgi:hypothetical protein
MTCVDARQRQPPALSPANTTFEARVASWFESSGGYKRDRYAVKISKRAAGKVF